MNAINKPIRKKNSQITWLWQTCKQIATWILMMINNNSDCFQHGQRSKGGNLINSGPEKYDCLFQRNSCPLLLRRSLADFPSAGAITTINHMKIVIIMVTIIIDWPSRTFQKDLFLEPLHPHSKEWGSVITSDCVTAAIKTANQHLIITFHFLLLLILNVLDNNIFYV